MMKFLINLLCDTATAIATTVSGLVYIYKHIKTPAIE